MDHRGAVHQEIVARSLDALAALVSHGLLDDSVMDLQPLQRAGFSSAPLGYSPPGR